MSRKTNPAQPPATCKSAPPSVLAAGPGSGVVAHKGRIGEQCGCQQAFQRLTPGRAAADPLQVAHLRQGAQEPCYRRLFVAKKWKRHFVED